MARFSRFTRASQHVAMITASAVLFYYVTADLATAHRISTYTAGAVIYALFMYVGEGTKLAYQLFKMTLIVFFVVNIVLISQAT